MTGAGPGFVPDPDDLVAAAARTRRRRRDEADLTRSEATLADTLAGLARSGTSVTVVGAGGTERRGRVRGVGADVVALESAGRRWWLRMATIVAVRPHGPLHVDLGDPADAEDRKVRLDEVVAGLAGTREHATFTMVGGWTVSGEVEWCGEELAGVVAEGAPSALIYLASVSEVSLAAPSAESAESE